MKRATKGVLLCVLNVWGGVSLWSSMLPFSSFSPYLGEDNQWCVRFETQVMNFSPVLWLYETTFLYSPTREAGVDIAIPLWHWSGQDVILGDVTVDFRGVAFRDEAIHWRGMFLFGFRLPTGVSAGAGMRRVEERVVSYFPYSTGALGWRAGMMVSYLALPVWFHGTFAYVSEYTDEQTLLDMDIKDDGLMAQLVGDMLFRFSSFRFLVSVGVFSWFSWGMSPWASEIRVWHKGTMFVGQWRLGYEGEYGQKGGVGLFLQYNF
ncbi:MAG: hypothetical protein N2314_05900 [Brevinematales bacterium]|nr:hypothetical protein [Brevinematales bacterium]